MQGDPDAIATIENQSTFNSMHTQSAPKLKLKKA